MKNLLLITLLFLGFIAQTQTLPLALRMDLTTKIFFEPKTYLAGGKVGTLDISVRNFDVYQTATGQYYINYKDACLVWRKKYLGIAFGEHIYEGNTVFFSTDTTKAWIWQLDRYGTPTLKMQLPDWFAGDVRAIKE